MAIGKAKCVILCVMRGAQQLKIYRHKLYACVYVHVRTKSEALATEKHKAKVCAKRKMNGLCVSMCMRALDSGVYGR